MSEPTPVPEKDIVAERDKPFILALCGTAITAATGILASLRISFIDPLAAADIFKATLTLTAMAWAYYFAKKD